MLNIERLPEWRPIEEFPDHPENELKGPEEAPGGCNLSPGPVMLREAIEFPPVLKLVVVALFAFVVDQAAVLIGGPLPR